MRSDGELQHDVQIELGREPAVNAERIEVRVVDGTVTLTGNVESEMESWSAGDAARRVAGVKIVVNETMIIRETSDQPADGDIARPWFPSS